MQPESNISAVVLTFNEIRNIEACLTSLREVAREILVVDSGSTDGTLECARSLGARVVNHPFSTHAAQWTFALSQPLAADWVLAIDADQRVSPELARDLMRIAVEASPDTEGVYVNRLHVFRGKPLTRGGLFPKWMLKMFRKGAGFTDEHELMDHRFYVRGCTVKADGLLVEDNRNEADISFWIDKHNRAATRQAREEFERARKHGEWAVPPRLFGTADQRVLLMKSLFYRMPRYSRPFLYFLYRYFVRLGFLDGKRGLEFHVLQAFWYRFLVDVKLDDIETHGGAS